MSNKNIEKKGTFYLLKSAFTVANGSLVLSGTARKIVYMFSTTIVVLRAPTAGLLKLVLGLHF